MEKYGLSLLDYFEKTMYYFRPILSFNYIYSWCFLLGRVFNNVMFRVAFIVTYV